MQFSHSDTVSSAAAAMDNSFFETSGCDPEPSEVENAMKSRSTGSSSRNASVDQMLKGLKGDSNDIWLSKLAKVGRDMVENAVGVTYMERYNSFITNKWPYELERGNLCHPRALALAGLAFFSLDPAPSAQCQVCLTILKNLQPNSNAWILHSEANPECYLIQLGQRDEIDDYSMDEVMDMIINRVYNTAKLQVEEREALLKKQLFTLKQLEISRTDQ